MMQMSACVSQCLLANVSSSIGHIVLLPLISYSVCMWYLAFYGFGLICTSVVYTTYSSYMFLYVYPNFLEEKSFYLCPDRLRLPLIFYVAHPATLYINKLLLAGMITV